MASRTARQTIEQALKRIGILSEEEAMTAPQSVDGLAQLNDLMQGFPSRGIQYVHETLTLDAALNVPDEQTRNVMLMLAWEMADGYGKTLSAKLVADIMEAKGALQAFYYEVPPAQIDDGLQNRLLRGSSSIQRI